MLTALLMGKFVKRNFGKFMAIQAANLPVLPCRCFLYMIENSETSEFVCFPALDKPTNTCSNF